MSQTSVWLALLAARFWSFLAFLSVGLAGVPAFLVTGIALGISGLLAATRPAAWRAPLRTLAVGFGGIFGNHGFAAYHYAPAVEVSLRRNQL